MVIRITKYKRNSELKNLRFWAIGIVAFLLLYGGIRIGMLVPDEHLLARAAIALYVNDEITIKPKWMGIVTQQFPLDAWIIQEIIYEQKPDFIIETGTLFGGSAALWALLQREVNHSGRIITVDIEPRAQKEKINPELLKRIDFVIGNSVDAHIVSKIHEKTSGKRCLVILDSNHSRDHVLKEMQCYWDLVSIGGYMIVEDTDLNGHPVFPSFGPGPWEAVQDFLKTNKQFKPDKYRERFMITAHPCGYLKRIS
jgi:cephalosporin hydroxylase